MGISRQSQSLINEDDLHIWIPPSYMKVAKQPSVMLWLFLVTRVKISPKSFLTPSLIRGIGFSLNVWPRCIVKSPIKVLPAIIYAGTPLNALLFLVKREREWPTWLLWRKSGRSADFDCLLESQFQVWKKITSCTLFRGISFMFLIWDFKVQCGNLELLLQNKECPKFSDYAQSMWIDDDE